MNGQLAEEVMEFRDMEHAERVRKSEFERT
jgi:hypothetical protein